MPSGLFMGSISTLIYTSELILCSTLIKEPSAATMSQAEARVNSLVLKTVLILVDKTALCCAKKLSKQAKKYSLCWRYFVSAQKLKF